METAHRITLELNFSRRKALVLLTLFFLCWRPASLGSETLTMTTYYPAPYGGYARLLTTNQTLLARDGGNVGIGMGNVAPRAQLDVNGQIVAVNRMTLAQNTATDSLTWHLDNTAGLFKIRHQPDINTPGTSHVTIVPNGQVTVGGPVTIGGGYLFLAARSPVIVGFDVRAHGFCTDVRINNNPDNAWTSCPPSAVVANVDFNAWAQEWTCSGNRVYIPYGYRTPDRQAYACVPGFKWVGTTGSLRCCRIQ